MNQDVEARLLQRHILSETYCMVTSSWQSNPQLEQSIGNWLESSLLADSTDQTLNLFQRLLIDGAGNPNPLVATAVEELALDRDKNAEREFLRIIDRSCYQIVINCLATDRTSFVSQLIDIIAKTESSREQLYAKLPRRLSYLWKLYAQSEYFQRLRKLQLIVTRRSTDSTASPSMAVLLDRYPFLYESNLLAEDVSKDYLEAIQRIKRRAQRDYEFRFSQYLTYQIRKARLKQQPDPQKTIVPVANPTLLRSRDFGTSLQSFVSKPQDGESYRDGAYSFQLQMQEPMTFVEFKEDLYIYLSKDLKSTVYAEQSFKTRLKNQIRNILPDNHAKPLDELSQVRTYTQLLNFLVIDSAERPNHVVLIDLVSNLGSATTVGLLLKIILICPKAQTSLNHRLSILFNHYYHTNQDQVPWLIKFLETWQVASSIHFGKIDASVLKQILGH
jgi:hypothetical protein